MSDDESTDISRRRAPSDPDKTGPVDGCKACLGHTLKIDGLCIKHYAAHMYDLDDLAELKREVERQIRRDEAASEGSA